MDKNEARFTLEISELDDYLQKSGPHKYISKKMVHGKWVYEYKDEAVTRITNSLLDFLSNPKRSVTVGQVARSFRVNKVQAKEVLDTLARQGNVVGSTEKGGVTTYKRNPRQKGATEKPKLVISQPEKLTVTGDKVGKKEKKQAREEAITTKAQKEKEQPKAPKVYFLNLPEKSQKIVNELASWKDVGLSPYHMAQKLHMPESEALTHMRALEDSGFVAPSKKNSKLVSSMQLYRLTTEAKKELGIIPTYYNDPKAKGVKQRLHVNEGISGWKPGPEIEFTGRTDFAMGSTVYEFTYQSGTKKGQTDFTAQKPKPEKETPKTETTKEKYEKLFTIGGSTAEKKSAAVKQELTEKEKKQIDEKRYRGKAELLRLLAKEGTVWLDKHPSIKQSDLSAMTVDGHAEKVTDFRGETAKDGFRVGYRQTPRGERAVNNMDNEQRHELERQQYEQRKKNTPPIKEQPKVARQVVMDWLQKQKQGGGITAVGMIKHFSQEHHLAIKDNVIYGALNQLANEGVLEREGVGYGGTFKKPVEKKEKKKPEPKKVLVEPMKSKYKPQKQGQLSFGFADK